MLSVPHCVWGKQQKTLTEESFKPQGKHSLLVEGWTAPPSHASWGAGASEERSNCALHFICYCFQLIVTLTTWNELFFFLPEYFEPLVREKSCCLNGNNRNLSRDPESVSEQLGSILTELHSFILPALLASHADVLSRASSPHVWRCCLQVQIRSSSEPTGTAEGPGSSHEARVLLCVSFSLSLPES